jgi:hypothetical protein
LQCDKPRRLGRYFPEIETFPKIFGALASLRWENQHLKPLKKVPSVQTAGLSAISGYSCHKKHKNAGKFHPLFVFFVPFAAQIIAWDYSEVSNIYRENSLFPHLDFGQQNMGLTYENGTRNRKSLLLSFFRPGSLVLILFWTAMRIRIFRICSASRHHLFLDY